MKKIDTLIADIETILTSPTVLKDEDVKRFSTSITESITSALAEPVQQPRLRMSNLGVPCDRKLWYTVNGWKGEDLPAAARLKFMFGHILEALVLLLAKAAGHDVSGQQSKLEISGVEGSRDAVIDGVTVDAKSSSTHSLGKFKEGLNSSNDSFGYRDQLGSYVQAGRDDPLVIDKDRGAFLAIDKTLGHMVLDVHNFKDKDYVRTVEEKKALVNQRTAPPRAYFDEEDGKSGNRKLGTVCSYCEFKKTCWPNVKTYAYSSGPKFLTVVKREPDVPRVD